MKDTELFFRFKLRAFRAESGEMGDKVSTHTGKVVPCFLNVLFADRYRHIFVLHNRISPRCLIKQHLVVFRAVLIQTVIGHRNKNGLLKIRFVEPAVIDCDFRGRTAVESVEKLRIFKEHCFLVLTACHGIVYILKLKGLCVLVAADKENTVCPDSLNRDNALHRFRHNKFFLVLLEQISKRF